MALVVAPGGAFLTLVCVSVLLCLTVAVESGFITRNGTQFLDANQPFRYGGTNNYYLHYKPAEMVNNLYSNASHYGFNVVRVWGFLDIGNADGSNSVDGIKEGVYFQYWDGSKPAYNDGPNGLQRLDFLIARASSYNLRLIVVLTNNWKDFGGMDQYVRWNHGSHHDSFYTNSRIKGWFKAWIGHVLNRRNTYTGSIYKDDPTIMAWELANEPRCQGSGDYSTSGSCNYASGAAILTRWVTEMSNFIKSIDSNHMVAVGDEGFACFDGASVGWDWTLDCYTGVDTLAFGKVNSIDFLTAHLYPTSWGKSLQWTSDFINNHTRWAHNQAGKPIVLEEFGLSYDQVNVYTSWTNQMLSSGYNGWNFWMLVTNSYPNYDGYAVYCPSSQCQLLSQQAARMR